jgi:purine nucleosidase
MPRTFLIDTDTASDDAVALIMALREPAIRVAAITAVAGNVPVAQAVRNALYVTELCGADVPVFAGTGKPLLREHMHAEWFHGRDGLGDHGYAPPNRAAERVHAVDAIIACVNDNPGITVVTLGPLTNVALALAQEPGIAEKVGRCIVMGGKSVLRRKRDSGGGIQHLGRPGSGPDGTAVEDADRTGGMASVPRRSSIEFG